MNPPEPRNTKSKRIGVAAIAIAIFYAAVYSATAAFAKDTLTQDLSSAYGTSWEFKPEGGDWKPIQVPAGGWRAQGYHCDAGTYRTWVVIPAEAQGRLVRVKFAAVNFGADVYAGTNEASLGKIASHINGWMPFTADLTPHFTPGQPVLLEVDVKGRKKYMVNGKYTVPEGATWYDGLAEGILRGVALEMVPPVHIEDVAMETSVGPDVLHPQATIVNGSDHAVKLNVSASLSSWNKTSFNYPAIPGTTVEIPAGAAQVVDLGNIAWPLGSKSYWWPNVPYTPDYLAQLHLLNVSLAAGGKVLHQYVQRFGFRQFQVRSNYYELNGIHCNLRGDNQQEANFGTDAYGVKLGFGPPSARNPGWPQAVDNLLRLNFNVMRIHQIPATPYMLDVCDERGLMLVEESPLRGSESGEDFVHGRENMLRMDRELVLRDRDHPAVVIWSAANEWAEPIPDAVKTILEVDATRPIIADGVGGMAAPYINMEHYVTGMPGLPKKGGHPRADRPFGETEAVWPADNTWQGFAWMATGTRLRRLQHNADIRNYVLNNAWPNYVPGEGPDTEILERKVKNMGPDLAMHAALSDVWHQPLIRLMQQCYHPLTAADIEFDRMNAPSNARGEWPIIKPRIAAGARVVRKVAVFNDEFAGGDVVFRWEARSADATGAVIGKGEDKLRIPLGEFVTHEVAFNTPATPGEINLRFSVFKNGQERFTEDKTTFTVVANLPDPLADGNYRLVASHSDMAAEVSGAVDQAGAPVVQAKRGDSPGQIWHLKQIADHDFRLTNRKTGMVLAIADASPANEARAVQERENGRSNQLWHIVIGEDGRLNLQNKNSGKMLDVYAASHDAGARIVQWDPNGGDNQAWELQACPQ